MVNMNIRYAVLMALTGIVTGCAVGPDYVRPDVPMSARFKESDTWKAADPQDEMPRGAWWERFGDPELNALVEQVQVSNQNVRASEAAYRQAVGALDAAWAAYFPTLSTSFAATRAQGVQSSTSASSGATVSPGSPIRNTDRLSVGVSNWEIDLWGRISRNVEANVATVAATQGDLQAALLSAQGTLAQTYMQLRTNDAQRKLLGETVAAYERSLEITRNRYNVGVAGRVDVVQAETQLKSAKAQLIDLGVQRAQYEHAIAVLVGKAPAEFSIAVTGRLPELPALPAGIPSALLERRPDIAAAERRAASANASIGVAQAAFFPTLTLGATGGYQNTSLSDLLSTPNRFWSLGPTLALTLFDAGSRSAAKAQAVAAYDKSVATYRQTVLAAFQDVEDNLASLRVLGDEATTQQEAAQLAAETLRLTDNQYRAGTVSYLNVVTAQATSLSADQNVISITGRRLVAAVGLLKALGGGWEVPNTARSNASAPAARAEANKETPND